MSKSFWGVVAVVILIFVGIFAFTGNKTKTTNNGGKTSSTSTLTNHTIGKGTSGVTLLEYGDFQCPYCGLYYPIVKQVQAKYNDQLKFQFRHFPITSAHPNAFAASRAAEASASQGKFWEMYDALYQTQKQWAGSSDPTTIFEQFAKQIGMDVNKYKVDYKSIAVNDLINADMAEGTKLGVTGTPTFFINGKKVEINQDPADFSKKLDAAIAQKAKAN